MASVLHRRRRPPGSGAMPGPPGMPQVHPVVIRTLPPLTHPAALGDPSARPEGQPEMTMPNGGPQDLADPADDRSLTYNDAGTVYQTSLTAARDRYAELSDRDLSARTAALLRERGEFDPANLGHQLVAASGPLSAAEHLEHMAIGEVLARYYRHPSMLRAVISPRPG